MCGTTTQGSVSQARFSRIFPSRLVVIFGMTGLMAGFLAGISSSPVVGSLLTVLAGFVGAIGASALERFGRNQEIKKRLEGAISSIRDKSAGSDKGLDETAEKQLLGVLEPDTTAAQLPKQWQLGIMVFLVTLALGIPAGGWVRVLHYPTFEELLDETKVDKEKTPKKVKGAMYALYVRCKVSRLPRKDMVDLFAQVVAPMTADKDWSQSAVTGTSVAELNALRDSLPAGSAIEPQTPLLGR